MPDTEFKKGDRVLVMDLRTGLQTSAVVTKATVPNSNYISLKYDGARSIYRVNIGWIRKLEDD